MAEELRTCKKCGKSKPLSEFYPYKSVKGDQIILRRPYTCRDCDMAKHKRAKTLTSRRAIIGIGGSHEAKALKALNYLFKQFEPKLKRRGPYQKERYPYRGFRIRGMWDYPLEERAMRGLRFLLYQYDLPTPRYTPEQRPEHVGEQRPPHKALITREVACHLPGRQGQNFKRTLCGRLITEDIVIVGSGDVTCGMCKKLSDKGE